MGAAQWWTDVFNTVLTNQKSGMEMSLMDINDLLKSLQVTVLNMFLAW